MGCEEMGYEGMRYPQSRTKPKAEAEAEAKAQRRRIIYLSFLFFFIIPAWMDGLVKGLEGINTRIFQPASQPASQPAAPLTHGLVIIIIT